MIDNGWMLTQPKHIAEAFAMYYIKLLPHSKEKIESFFNSVNLTKLTADEADMMMAPTKKMLSNLKIINLQL